MQYHGRYADYIMQRNTEKRCVPQSRWLWAAMTWQSFHRFVDLRQ